MCQKFKNCIKIFYILKIDLKKVNLYFPLKYEWVNCVMKH